MGERLVVGRVAKAHGIRGEVSIEVLTDHPDRFAVGARLESNSGPLTVEASREHQKRILVKFAEVPDRNSAEALRGLELTIDEADAARLPEGRWYPHHLEGFDVALRDGGEVGTFDHVVESRAHDLWAVRTPQGREVLVPVIFVEDVDVERRRIVIAPPEGLF